MSEAAEIIARLAGPDTAATDEQVVFQCQQIEKSLEIESVGGPFRFTELIQGGKIGNFRRLCLAMAVNAMQQFTGSNMINYCMLIFPFRTWLYVQRRIQNLLKFGRFYIRRIRSIISKDTS